MLKTVLRTMSNISKCVEKHIENFKAWVVLQKKAWRDLLKTYFTELIQLKYKLILWIKTMNGMLWSCMCSLIEILWVLEEKISLNCWQLQHDVPVTEIFEFNPPVNFLYFLSNWVNLLGIFTTREKPRAFERNPSLWSSYLIPWRPIVYL